MRISFVIEYLGRCHRELKKLSSKGEGHLLYLWWDFMKCSVIHGAILNHYTRGKLYTLKGCERRKSVTYGRILKAYKRCNSSASIPYLNNKHLFNEHFKQYVNRKWLYSPKMGFDQFSTLCDNCKAIIIKPEDGVEGYGVRKITPPIC